MGARKPKNAPEREEDHPFYYRGLERTIDGERAAYQHGSYFSLGQATELYTPPREGCHSGIDYDLSIGTLALNTGEWLALHAREKPRRTDPHRMSSAGGFSLGPLTRRFASRDEALRANAAYVLWKARHRFHIDLTEERRRYISREWKISEARYRQLVAFVYDVLGRQAPEVFIAPPPPPPIIEQKPDATGQMRFAL